MRSAAWVAAHEAVNRTATERRAFLRRFVFIRFNVFRLEFRFVFSLFIMNLSFFDMQMYIVFLNRPNVFDIFLSKNDNFLFKSKMI